MSRPLIRSGQWSQTTKGIFQPVDRFRVDPTDFVHGTKLSYC